VVLDDTAVPTASQRWSHVVRIPFRTAALVDPNGVRYTPPTPVSENIVDPL
jgi:hypothetical protein